MPVHVSSTQCSKHVQAYNTLIIKQDFFCIKLVNPLNAELNPICHLLALLGAHHIFHVSGLRVNY